MRTHERSRHQRWFLAALWTISPCLEMTNRVLKKRLSITSGQRALHWATIYVSYCRAREASRSVSGPGISMNRSRAARVDPILHDPQVALDVPAAADAVHNGGEPHRHIRRHVLMRASAHCVSPSAGGSTDSSRLLRTVCLVRPKPGTSWLDLIAWVTVGDARRPRNRLTRRRRHDTSRGGLRRAHPHGGLRPGALKVRHAVIRSLTVIHAGSTAGCPARLPAPSSSSPSRGAGERRRTTAAPRCRS